MSISGDGRTIAVGAPFNDGINGNDSGQVRIYHFDDDGMKWEKIGNDIYGDAAGDWFGSSVSLSANGTIIAIGAIYAGVYEILTGGVNVYRIDSAGLIWERLGKSIYGDNDGDNFGWSVDISYDGSTIAVGSHQNGNGQYGIGDPGYVRVFSLEGSDSSGNNAYNWKQIGKNITGEASNDAFGWSVSLSDDGKTVATGAINANGINGEDSGRVRVYRMSGSDLEWTPLGKDIDGDVAYEKSGWLVSLSGDGNSVAIGSPFYDNDNEYYAENVGQVRVFILE